MGKHPLVHYRPHLRHLFQFRSRQQLQAAKVINALPSAPTIIISYLGTKVVIDISSIFQINVQYFHIDSNLSLKVKLFK